MLRVDLLKELEARVAELRWYPRHESVAAACHHISVAERYLSQARHDANLDMFNDVVYRCNHAFEGMIEETYIAAALPAVSNATLHGLEKSLFEGAVLPKRVISLIEGYRREWRNSSIHEHQAVFSEQEALLALVNVVALALVLCDQIIATTAAARERNERQDAKATLAAALADTQRQPLVARVITLLQNFVEDLARQRSWPSTAAELIRRVEGFLTSVDSQLEVERNAFDPSTYDSADLLITSRGDAVIIDVLYGKITPNAVRQTVEHVATFLRGSAAGVVFGPPLGPWETEVAKRVVSRKDNQFVWIIAQPGVIAKSLVARDEP